MIRSCTALTALLAAAAFAASASAAGKPGYGCGVGFDLGALTYDEQIALERTQQAIADGLATEDALRAGLAAVDANGDGLVCVQLPHGFEQSNRPYGEYYYNLSDNNASVPD